VNSNDKVAQLQDEIKILKNEVQAVLVDLRESYLNRENPFSADASAMAQQPAAINLNLGMSPAMPQQPKEINKDEPPPVAEEQTDEPELEEDQDSELIGVGKPVDEPEPDYQQQLAAIRETARKEVKRAWRPDMEMGAHIKPEDTSNGDDGKASMATIAALAQWVTELAKRLGRERAEAILDISEMMGHLSRDVRKVLVKFINLTPEVPPGEVSTRDYLVSLVELEYLLGKSSNSELALLSILYKEDSRR
jgi:archaellum component FlaD/FlaE